MENVIKRVTFYSRRSITQDFSLHAIRIWTVRRADNLP